MITWKPCSHMQIFLDGQQKLCSEYDSLFLVLYKAFLSQFYFKFFYIARDYVVSIGFSLFITWLASE